MNNDVVILQLDRPRAVKFSHTALKTLASMTGQTVEELDNQLDVHNFEFMEQMAYCGLLKDAKDNGETLKLEQIPDLLDEAPSWIHVVERIISAWRIAFGAPPQTEGNAQSPAGKQPANVSSSTGKRASG